MRGKHMDNSNKIILDLCGGTGGWSRPYKEAGYDVRLITLPDNDARLWPSQPSDPPRLPSGFNDIAEYIGNVYGILAAPVCTCFSGSGACHPRSDEQLLEGLSLVDACLRIIWTVKPKFWAMENPVGKLRKWIGPPKMSFHPCDYGDPYTKKTLLWGEFNELVKNPVEPTEGSKLWAMYGGKSARTKEMRSITPQGFAQAFYRANQ
jgi:hypothetical protein